MAASRLSQRSEKISPQSSSRAGSGSTICSGQTPSEGSQLPAPVRADTVESSGRPKAGGGVVLE